MHRAVLESVTVTVGGNIPGFYRRSECISLQIGNPRETWCGSHQELFLVRAAVETGKSQFDLKAWHRTREKSFSSYDSPRMVLLFDGRAGSFDSGIRLVIENGLIIVLVTHWQSVAEQKSIR